MRSNRISNTLICSDWEKYAELAQERSESRKENKVKDEEDFE